MKTYTQFKEFTHTCQSQNTGIYKTDDVIIQVMGLQRLLKGVINLETFSGVPTAL